MKSSRKRKRQSVSRALAEQAEARLLLDASGLFGDVQTIMFPDTAAKEVVLGDMDNDSDIDAVFIGGDGTSQVLVNDGLGNFQSSGFSFGPTDPRIGASEIADLDGDGYLDVAISESPSGGVRVWRNSGSLEFAPFGTTLLPTRSPGLVSVADLDGDSDLDLAITSAGNHVFFNDGHGAFTPSTDTLVGGYNIVGDFDGDSDVDLLVDDHLFSGEGNGRLLKNDGTGHFPSFQSVPMSVVPRATNIGDFDGDSDLDVYESNRYSSDGNGHLFFNDGNGGFSDSGQVFRSRNNWNQDYASCVGDVDLDGDLDLVVAHQYSDAAFTGVTIWLNDGTGHFTQDPVSNFYPESIALGDIDADGDLDVVGRVGDYLQTLINRTILDVQLPTGGGSFEAIQSGLDVVIRQQAGAEIFREPAEATKILRVLGSTSDDRIDASSITGIAVVLNGGDGNDTLIGGSNADTLDGGSGDDSTCGNNGADQIVGGVGNDVLNGNMGNDRLDGGDDQDTLLGGAGLDELRGGNGNDALNGGAGNDRMYGEAGCDVLRADAGNDSLDGGTEADTLVGDDGNDSIFGGDGDDMLRGVTGRDTLDGGNGNDDMRGGADNDSLLGSAGNDTLNGNIGNDTLLGGYGDDAIAGGMGNDLVSGSAGRDTLLGGIGNDTLLGGADADILLSNDGDDYLDGQGHSHDTLNGGSGANTVLGLATEIDAAFTLIPGWLDRA